MNFARIISRLVENCPQTFILSRCIGQNYKVGGRLLAELECFLPLLPPGKKDSLMWDPTICMGPPRHNCFRAVVLKTICMGPPRHNCFQAVVLKTICMGPLSRKWIIILKQHLLNSVDCRLMIPELESWVLEGKTIVSSTVLAHCLVVCQQRQDRPGFDKDVKGKYRGCTLNTQLRYNYSP